MELLSRGGRYSLSGIRAKADLMARKLLERGRLSMRQERTIGLTMLVAGLIIAGAAVTRMDAQGVVTAQAPPPAATPAPEKADKPAESMPGGTRPTTPAPEPARPQRDDGATTGSSPPASPQSRDRPPVTGTPLPPAPAEKNGPPLQGK